MKLFVVVDKDFEFIDGPFNLSNRFFCFEIKDALYYLSKERLVMEAELLGEDEVIKDTFTKYLKEKIPLVLEVKWIASYTKTNLVK